MKKLLLLFKQILLTTLLFSQLSFANNKISDGEVYTYIDLSGLKDSIQGMPAQIEMMSQQIQLTSQNAQKDEVVMSALISSWQEDKINQQIIKHIQANMTQAEMTELLSWLNTDLAKRIKLAELQSSQPDFQNQVMHFMADIQSNPPTPARQSLVRNFIEVTNISDHATDVAMAIVENMMNSVQIAMPNEQIPTEQIKQQLTQMRTMMAQAMDQQMIMLSYFLYRDISDDDLTNYTEFYQQPLGQKELTVVYGAVLKGLNAWGDDIAVTLVNHFKDQKK